MAPFRPREQATGIRRPVDGQPFPVSGLEPLVLRMMPIPPPACRHPGRLEVANRPFGCSIVGRLSTDIPIEAGVFPGRTNPGATPFDVPLDVTIVPRDGKSPCTIDRRLSQGWCGRALLEVTFVA